MIENVLRSVELLAAVILDRNERMLVIEPSSGLDQFGNVGYIRFLRVVSPPWLVMFLSGQELGSVPL